MEWVAIIYFKDFPEIRFGVLSGNETHRSLLNHKSLSPTSTLHYYAERSPQRTLARSWSTGTTLPMPYWGNQAVEAAMH